MTFFREKSFSPIPSPLRSMEPKFRTHVHCLGKQVRYHLDLWRECISPSKSDVPALSEAS